MFTVWLKRLDTAPSLERWTLTVLIAVSIAVIAAIALEGLSRVGPDDELVEELEEPVDEEDDPVELLDDDEPLEELLDKVDMPASNIWANTPLLSPS